MPLTPRAGATWRSAVGGGGEGGNSRRHAPAARSDTGWSRKKRANARSVQPDLSEPSAEWPVAGATTSFACGNWAATRWAPSTGVRRSSSPSSSSTGTSGSGPGPNDRLGRGGGPAVAQLEQVVLEQAGAVERAGTASPGSAPPRPRPGGGARPDPAAAVRAHGKRISSQVVAVNSAVLISRGGGGSPSTENERRPRRSSGSAVAVQRGAHRAREAPHAAPGRSRR